MNSGEPATQGDDMIEIKTPSFLKSTAILTATLVAVSLVIYSVARVPLSQYSDTKIGHFKTRNFGNNLASARTRIASQLGLDALNHKGVNGKMDYDNGSGELTMTIRNRDGEPMSGIQVIAQLSLANGQPGPRLMMHQDENQKYAAPIREFGPGNWHVTVSASDPDRTSGSDVMFQVEKYVQVR